MSSKPLSYGNHPKWQAHNSNSGFGLATVATSLGDRFVSANGPQEPPRGNMYKPSHYSTTPMLGPVHWDNKRTQKTGDQISGIPAESRWKYKMGYSLLE
jgi:hypothetical protein